MEKVKWSECFLKALNVFQIYNCSRAREVLFSFVCHNRIDWSSTYLPIRLITTSWVFSTAWTDLCVGWPGWPGQQQAHLHSTNISPLFSQWLGQMFPLVSSYFWSQWTGQLLLIFTNTNDTSVVSSGKEMFWNGVVLAELDTYLFLFFVATCFGTLDATEHPELVTVCWRALKYRASEIHWTLLRLKLRLAHCENEEETRQG